MTALRLEGVAKRYGALLAVDGLDLVARPGEVLGLLGPNGAGKTTTVSLATGLLLPDAGRVVIEGAGPPTSPLARRRLGVAPQALAVYEDLTARENLEFFAALFRVAKPARRDHVARALEFVGLADRADLRVSVFSGGMKRRLNLAAAVVHDPEIVLLDEPTVGVDPQSRRLIFERVLALRGRGCAVVYATHYMEEAERLCDRVAILDHGRLLALDTVAGLVAAHGGKGVLVVETEAGEVRVETDDPRGQLNRLAASAEVRTFRVEQARLEDVFLHLTGRQLRD